MNREIKFRGKRLDNGKWEYGFLLKSASTFIAIDVGLVDGHFELYNVDPETVGQFTGLKDRNGKEIYEGDIITNLYGDIGVIVLKERTASFVCSLNLVSFNSVNWDKCVIVGNIYDNPELIHDQKMEVSK